MVFVIVALLRSSVGIAVHNGVVVDIGGVIPYGCVTVQLILLMVVMWLLLVV